MAVYKIAADEDAVYEKALRKNAVYESVRYIRSGDWRTGNKTGRYQNAVRRIQEPSSGAHSILFLSVWDVRLMGEAVRNVTYMPHSR